MNAIIEKMRSDGYPYKMKGNGGYTAVLHDVQPLNGGDYMAIYRYPWRGMLPRPVRDTDVF